MSLVMLCDIMLCRLLPGCCYGVAMVFAAMCVPRFIFHQAGMYDE